MKPLEGIRVLDFSQLHGAAYATMLLADFGAEVVKIENPEGGDKLRGLPPLKDGASAYHAYLNRGKKSVAVDLKTVEGREIARALARESDVVCENFKYGTMDRLGLGYDELSRDNPDLIYAALTGYGRSGERKSMACFDNTAQAFSGMLDMSGYLNGPPVTMGAQLGNLYGGIQLAFGILLAVIHVRKGGRGQAVDVSASDCLFAVLEDGMINCSMLGRKHVRSGNMSLAIAPYDTYKTLDGFVSIGVSSDYQWEKFCRVMGMEDLLSDPRFSSNGRRGENYISGGLRDRIESVTSAMTKRRAEELLAGENIPCGSVCTVLEAMESEQIRHREMIVALEDPAAGEIHMPGIPVKLDRTPGDAKHPAPLLGQHSVEYLRMLHYGEDAVEDFLSRKIICCSGKPADCLRSQEAAVI